MHSVTHIQARKIIVFIIRNIGCVTQITTQRCKLFENAWEQQRSLSKGLLIKVAAYATGWFVSVEETQMGLNKDLQQALVWHPRR